MEEIQDHQREVLNNGDATNETREPGWCVFTVGTVRQLFFLHGRNSMLNVQSSIFNVQCSKAGSQIGGFSDENKHLSI